MSNYLMRYKGKYRIKANIDESTNDFPRGPDGNINTDDLYIQCANNCQIYHYGYSTLVAYIPSLTRGHNILRALGKELLGIEDKISYEDLYNQLETQGTIRNIKDTDKEVEFHFHSKNLELIAKYLYPKTSGAGISPFSTKNLPKDSYTIPVEDFEEYKKITKDIPKEDILLISRITNDFLFKKLQKTKAYKTKNIKAEMKLKKLKGKEFIHSIGKWDEYLKYLSKNLN